MGTRTSLMRARKGYFTVWQRILLGVLEGEQFVTQLIKSVDTANTTFFVHLQYLKDWGLVETHREGRRVYVSLTGKGEKVAKIVSLLQSYVPS